MEVEAVGRPRQLRAGEAGGPADLRPRQNHVVRARQSDFVLNPRRLLLGEVGADARQFRRTFIGLVIGAEHVVFAGAVVVGVYRSGRIIRMASDDAVREQAIGPGRDTSEVPRRQHHLDHPAGRCQRRVRRRRPDHQDVVGPHRRRQGVIIIHRERDVPAQPHVAVVLPRRRQEVRVAGGAIAGRFHRPTAVVPVVGINRQRIGPRHFRVLQPAHDISPFRTAMRRDAAGINPFVGTGHMEQADHVVAADVQHIVGTQQVVQPGSGEGVGQRRVGLLARRAASVGDHDGFPVIQPERVGRQITGAGPCVLRVILVVGWIHLYLEIVLAQIDRTARSVVDFHVLVVAFALTELAEEQIGGAGPALHEEGVGALSADGCHPHAGGIDPQRHKIGVHPLRHQVGEVAVLGGGAGVGGVQQQVHRRGV
ncbi:MAG: hypothetical protein BWX79_02579 [Alphaproteobacteria bacterium ADurb.Bin100]|nr:MAG: hypothetical protein BWX79_02579 [Alphaproteobacteria bacterium ADurb.Bin100]